MIKSRQKHETNEPVGTPYYVAPEILQGECTQKCDMWSAGVILFMLITGKPPYDGIDDKDIVMNIKDDKLTMEVHDVPDVSSECRDLVHKLLERNFHLRLSAKEALEHPWIK